MGGQPTMNIISYHELRKISPQKARELVRKVFESNNKNVSKTAKILGVSRHTVRRAVYGPLEDKSKKPKSSPKKLSSELENFIVEESKKLVLDIDVCLFIFSENMVSK